MANETLEIPAKPQPGDEQSVHRLVLWNLKASVTAEQVHQLDTEGRDLLLQIPGVINIWTGVASDPDAAYRNYALITIKSPEMIEVFDRHPLHAQFGELYFIPIISDHMVINYILKT